LSKVISPLPLGERERVRGKKGEGWACLSLSSRLVFHNFFEITGMIMSQRGLRVNEKNPLARPQFFSLGLPGGESDG
jgi:hypothetical protein